jgi:F420-dependent oxidoreductase-like protein
MANRLHFGIPTAQQNISYEQLLDIWLEVDKEPLIEHMWLFDHFTPLRENLDGPCYEAWTLLAGLAARTDRVRLGHMVTGNTYRHPAIVARQAVTVDHISNGRLNFGIGAAWHEQEHKAYGIPFPGAGERVRRLDEACQVIRKLWTETKPSFEGHYYQLQEAPSEPKPYQQPHPPIMIAARGEQMLRVVAKHADIWAAQSHTLEEFREMSARLNQRCEEIGRDPATLERLAVASVNLAEADLQSVRESARGLIQAGATHIILQTRGSFPEGFVRRLVDEVVKPLKEELEG